jgi:uncharacterized membrane protein SpoIIM required for sporulation
MKSISSFIQTVIRAVVRARFSVLTIALTYVAFIVLGIVLTHTGNSYALKARDQLVNKAMQQDPAAIANNKGNNLQAAFLDFGSNLIIGAIPKAASGMAVVPAYPLVAYQGWVGGIVSVRADHSSRLNNVRSAVYYLLTWLLQIIAYSLAIGAGVNVGIAMFRPQPYYQGDKWLGIFPKEALRDVVRIYALVIPLFLVASLWEFLSPWNF